MAEAFTGAQHRVTWCPGQQESSVSLKWLRDRPGCCFRLYANLGASASPSKRQRQQELPTCLNSKLTRAQPLRIPQHLICLTKGFVPQILPLKTSAAHLLDLHGVVFDMVVGAQLALPLKIALPGAGHYIEPLHNVPAAITYVAQCNLEFMKSSDHQLAPAWPHCASLRPSVPTQELKCRAAACLDWA